MTILQGAEVGLKSCNAVTTEEVDDHIYRDFAESLRKEFSASAELFEKMASEENGHRHRLTELYQT
jgi:rubrerythrin